MNGPAEKFWAEVKREGAIYQGMDKESDRGGAILCASLVEERLKSALLARLKHLPVAANHGKRDTFAACIEKAAKRGRLRDACARSAILRQWKRGF
jgi:hypothetical protein